VLPGFGNFLRRPQAACADVQLYRPAIDLDGVVLNIGPPHALGARRPHSPATTVLMLDVLAKLRPLAADITFAAQLVSIPSGIVWLISHR